MYRRMPAQNSFLNSIRLVERAEIAGKGQEPNTGLARAHYITLNDAQPHAPRSNNAAVSSPQPPASNRADPSFV
jgi:hypothetical protein